MDDSRVRKEKVADSKISGYVWTGPKHARVTNRNVPQQCSRHYNVDGFMVFIVSVS